MPQAFFTHYLAHSFMLLLQWSAKELKTQWKNPSVYVTTMLNSKKVEGLGKIKRSREGEGKRSRSIRPQRILYSSLCYIEKATPNK